MSNHQNGTELIKFALDLSGKVAFMLITASTASIAYILAQVKQETWSSLIYFPIFALSLLAISFMFGYSHLSNRLKVTHANSLLLQLANEKNMDAEKKKLFEDLDKYSNKAAQNSRLQYLTFIFGAAIYAIYVFLSIFMK